MASKTKQLMRMTRTNQSMQTPLQSTGSEQLFKNADAAAGHTWALSSGRKRYAPLLSLPPTQPYVRNWIVVGNSVLVAFT